VGNGSETNKEKHKAIHKRISVRKTVWIMKTVPDKIKIVYIKSNREKS
jgi:hypothetical protein